MIKKDFKPSELKLVFSWNKEGAWAHPKTNIQDYDRGRVSYCRRANQRRRVLFFQGFLDVTRPRRPDIFWLQTSPGDDRPRFQTSPQKSFPRLHLSKKNWIFCHKKSQSLKNCSPTSFCWCLMNEIFVRNYMSAINEKKTQIARKNDIAFFASEEKQFSEFVSKNLHESKFTRIQASKWVYRLCNFVKRQLIFDKNCFFDSKNSKNVFLTFWIKHLIVTLKPVDWAPLIINIITIIIIIVLSHTLVKIVVVFIITPTIVRTTVSVINIEEPRQI